MSTVAYLVHDDSGQILRTGHCRVEDFARQADNPGEHVLFATGNDLLHKVVDGEIVERSAAEMKTQEQPEVKEEDRPVCVTQGQWQAIQDRLAALEAALNR